MKVNGENLKIKFVISLQDYGFGILKSPNMHMRDKIKKEEMITIIGVIAIILSGIYKNLFVNLVNY